MDVGYIHTKHIQKNDKAPWIKLICRLITRRQTIGLLQNQERIH